MKNRITLLLVLVSAMALNAQQVNVLFVGNSYTEVNNLPGMVADIAASMGEDIATASNTPGGCTFMQHCTNQSMELICRGGWDIVVLQEQSQYPSFPQEQVEREVFPFAARLIDSVYAHNACAEPMLYMTWGRKNGDERNAQYFPVLGTYEGMDSMLCERYTYMAQAYDAALCPVGRVWRHLRTYHPEIELYQQDGSHPSVAGTYAAACAFYTMIFHRDPDSIAHDATLDSGTARTIRQAVHTVVYENLEQWQRQKPSVSGTAHADIDGGVMLEIECLNSREMHCLWGDGADTVIENPAWHSIQHTYTDTGRYTITLAVERHCMTDTATMEIHIGADSTATGTERVPTQSISIHPNPTAGTATLTAPHGATIRLATASGKVIWEKGNASGIVTVPLDKCHKGAYIVTVETEDGTSSAVVIRE